MRWKTVQFLGITCLLTLVWVVIRFPYLVDIPIWNDLRRGKVDPTSLHLEGEFVESNLGSAELPNGSIEVRMIAQQYLFVPHCVVIPAGVPVHFRVTSADVVHQLTVSGTDYSIKTVPGVVSETLMLFPHVGEYDLPCHEFCGAGHYAMRSKLVVIPREEFVRADAGEGVYCAAH
jgi:cytochrome c oxidase subunit II